MNLRLPEKSRIKKGIRGFSRQGASHRIPPPLVPPPPLPHMKERMRIFMTYLHPPPLCPFRTPLVICMIYYQPTSSSKFGVRVCNSVPSYIMTCVHATLRTYCPINVYLSWTRKRSERKDNNDLSKKKKKDKREKGRATFSHVPTD